MNRFIKNIRHVFQRVLALTLVSALIMPSQAWAQERSQPENGSRILLISALSPSERYAILDTLHKEALASVFQARQTGDTERTQYFETYANSLKERLTQLEGGPLGEAKRAYHGWARFIELKFRIDLVEFQRTQREDPRELDLLKQLFANQLGFSSYQGLQNEYETLRPFYEDLEPTRETERLIQDIIQVAQYANEPNQNQFHAIVDRYSRHPEIKRVLIEIWNQITSMNHRIQGLREATGSDTIDFERYIKGLFRDEDSISYYQTVNGFFPQTKDLIAKKLISDMQENDVSAPPLVREAFGLNPFSYDRMDVSRIQDITEEQLARVVSEYARIRAQRERVMLEDGISNTNPIRRVDPWKMMTGAPSGIFFNPSTLAVTAEMVGVGMVSLFVTSLAVGSFFVPALLPVEGIAGFLLVSAIMAAMMTPFVTGLQILDAYNTNQIQRPLAFNEGARIMGTNFVALFASVTIFRALALKWPLPTHIGGSLLMGGSAYRHFESGEYFQGSFSLALATAAMFSSVRLVGVRRNGILEEIVPVENRFRLHEGERLGDGEARLTPGDLTDHPGIEPWRILEGQRQGNGTPRLRPQDFRDVPQREMLKVIRGGGQRPQIHSQSGGEGRAEPLRISPDHTDNPLRLRALSPILEPANPETRTPGNPLTEILPSPSEYDGSAARRLNLLTQHNPLEIPPPRSGNHSSDYEAMPYPTILFGGVVEGEDDTHVLGQEHSSESPIPQRRKIVRVIRDRNGQVVQIYVFDEGEEPQMPLPAGQTYQDWVIGIPNESIRQGMPVTVMNSSNGSGQTAEGSGSGEKEDSRDLPQGDPNLSVEQRVFLERVYALVSGEEARQYIQAVDKGSFLVSTPDHEFFVHIGEERENTPTDFYMSKEVLFSDWHKAQSQFRRYVISNPHLHPLLRSGMGRLMPYQRDALKQMLAHFEAESEGLVILPTATGKTVLAAHYAIEHWRSALARGERPRLLFIVDNLEILNQTAEKFRHIWEIAAPDLPPLKTGMYTGQEKFLDQEQSGHVDAVFASFQTLINPDHRAALGLEGFSLIIIDEFHKGGAPVYNGVVQEAREANAEVLGLTATPFRSIDDIDVPAILENHIIYNDYTVAQALAEGWVASFVPVPITDDVDREELIRAMEQMGKIGFENLKSNDRYKLFVQEWLEGVIEKYKVHAWDEQSQRFKKGLIYVHNQAAAKLLERMFELANIKGLNAKAIISDLTQGEQEQRTEQFRSGAINVAITCNKFKEGVDIPDIEIIVHLKKVKSMVSYAHEIGRGMRVAPGKTEVILLEFMFDYETMARFIEFCEGEMFPGGKRRTLPTVHEMEKLFSVLLGREIQFDEQTIEVFDRQRGALVSANQLREDVMREWARLWTEAKESGDGEAIRKLSSVLRAAEVFEVDQSTLRRYLGDENLRQLLPEDLLTSLEQRQRNSARNRLRAFVEEWARRWQEAKSNGDEDLIARLGVVSRAAEVLEVNEENLRRYLGDENLRELLPEDLLTSLGQRQSDAVLDRQRAVMEEWARRWQEVQSNGDEDLIAKLSSASGAAEVLAVGQGALSHYARRVDLISILPQDLREILEKRQQIKARIGFVRYDREEVMFRWASLWREAKEQQNEDMIERLSSVQRAAEVLAVGQGALGHYTRNADLISILPQDLREILFQRRHGVDWRINPRAPMEEWARLWDEAKRLNDQAAQRQLTLITKVREILGVSQSTLLKYLRNEELRNILPPDLLEILDSRRIDGNVYVRYDSRGVMEEWARRWQEAQESNDEGMIRRLGSAEGASRLLEAGVMDGTLRSYLKDEELASLLPQDLREILEEGRQRRQRHDRVAIMNDWARRWKEAQQNNNEDVIRKLSSASGASELLKIFASTLRIYLRDDDLRNLLPEDLREILAARLRRGQSGR